MTTIKFNKRHSFTVTYEGGVLTLFPGVNLNVEDWDKVKEHPIVKSLLEENTIDVLSRVPKSADHEGMKITDHKGDPQPVTTPEERVPHAKTK